MTEPDAQPNEVEVGWLVLGRLDEVDRSAVHSARDQTLDAVRDQLPELEWRMPLLERRDLHYGQRREPSELIAHGIDERDASHLDLVLVITGADLRAHGGKPFAIAVSSRAPGIGVLSTARIDPLARGQELGADERRLAIARRLKALALHVLGDLVGAGHDGEPASAMTPIDSVATLDEIRGYSQAARRSLLPPLRHIADRRLEESRRPPRKLWFVIRAAWINRRTIAGACWRARPWQLPFRLARLSAAAVSALVVLLIAAESWELALRVPAAAIAVLSCLSLCATVAHAVRRQRLLMSRSSARLTEQIVAADISVILIVGTGLLVTYVLLFGLSALLATLVFPRDVIGAWGDVPAVHAGDYLRISGFAAAIGLIIGALGASFESQHYVRHVTYVDEELG